MFTAPTALPDDPSTLQQILRAALAEIERLRLMIAGLQRNRFGRRSEQLDDAAFQQGVEELEQSLAEQTAALDALAPASQPAATEAPARPPRTEPAKRNRGALPDCRHKPIRWVSVARRWRVNFGRRLTPAGASNVRPLLFGSAKDIF